MSEHKDTQDQASTAWDAVHMPEPDVDYDLGDAGIQQSPSVEEATLETTRISLGPDSFVHDEFSNEPTDLSTISLDSGDEVLHGDYSPRRGTGELDAATIAAAEAAAAAERQAAEAAEREAAEAARQEAERAAAEREARNRALGVVAPSGPAIVAPRTPEKLVTDKFLGAAGLFLFRLVLAAVLGVRGYQMVTDIPALQEQLATTPLPEPNTMAWVAAISALAIALGLLFGAMVRVAGFGLLAMSALSLAFLRWGAFSPFTAGQFGFSGELELVLAAAGLLLLTLGGGGWGVDGSFRRSRAKAKAASQD